MYTNGQVTGILREYDARLQWRQHWATVRDYVTVSLCLFSRKYDRNMAVLRTLYSPCVDLFRGLSRKYWDPKN